MRIVRKNLKKRLEVTNQPTAKTEHMVPSMPSNTKASHRSGLISPTASKVATKPNQEHQNPPKQSSSFQINKRPSSAAPKPGTNTFDRRSEYGNLKPSIAKNERIPRPQDNKVNNKERNTEGDDSKYVLLKTSVELGEIEYKVAVISEEENEKLRFLLYNKRMKIAHNNLEMTYKQYNNYIDNTQTDENHRAILLSIIKEIKEDRYTEGLRWSRKLVEDLK